MIEKSISKRATRRQMLKVYALVLKAGESFNPAGATKNFKGWFSSHKNPVERMIIAGYAGDMLVETEKRLKLVRELLTEGGYLGWGGDKYDSDRE